MSTGINGNAVYPEMIIVGILNTDRTRDLTPTPGHTDPEGKITEFLKTSGGGETFTSFLEKELIPHIDSVYRTNNYRMLVGHSLGGLTAINILLNHTNMFNSYIAIDPSMWFDNRDLLKKAQTLLMKKNFEGRNLFVAIANTLPEGLDFEKVDMDTSSKTEHIRSIRKLVKALGQNPANGLRWRSQFFSMEDHGSVPLIAEFYGLNFIFEGYKTSFDLMLKGVDSVTKHYQEMSKRFGYTILPPAKIINQMGYYMLEGRQYQQALELFNLNVRNFPKSFAVYDSMGDAYAAMGDKTKASEFYKKALTINPNFKESQQKLENILGHSPAPSRR
jgi:hypothetical protein